MVGADLAPHNVSNKENNLSFPFNQRWAWRSGICRSCATGALHPIPHNQPRSTAAPTWPPRSAIVANVTHRAIVGRRMLSRRYPRHLARRRHRVAARCGGCWPGVRAHPDLAGGRGNQGGPPAARASSMVLHDQHEAKWHIRDLSSESHGATEAVRMFNYP
jgi:hypothetical protein